MNKIKEYRKKKNISQLELANKMNVKQNTISQWENDLREPTIRKGIELAKLLGTTVESLYK